MKRMQSVLALVVVFLTLVPLSSADWMDDMVREQKRRDASPEWKKLLALDAELQRILSRFNDVFEKYRDLGKERITPLNALSACNDFRRLGGGRDMAETREKARRVIAILQSARALQAERQWVLPGGLESAVNSNLSETMRQIVEEVEKLQSRCQ